MEGGQTYKLEMLSVLRSAAHSSDLVGMFRDGVVGGGELGGGSLQVTGIEAGCPGTVRGF